ncbi:MAG: hypothetical protein D6704_07535 [Nitrospirae bacterium]|nr:MAG: hypothetical protein D6704_07535 [Nitrospirota bacterium]
MKDWKTLMISFIGGVVGALSMQIVGGGWLGENVEAERSPHLVVDSLSTKELVVYNQKNEPIVRITSDRQGLPLWRMGRNDRGFLEFRFVSENQPSLTIVGGLGQSVSTLSVREIGGQWEPMLTLGHRDKQEGITLSIYEDTGNLLLSNAGGQVLRLDATQGPLWRRLVLAAATKE